MAKAVIWTRKAQNDRKKILKYWQDRNRSSAYSLLLNQKFEEAVNILKNHSGIGKPTNKIDIRVKVVRDYLIVYEDSNTLISILTIWDSRQNPKKLEQIIKT